ncbi:MAG: site-specific integrase [Gammaproteobacteria bacterium]
MATIFKRGDSPYWFARYRDARGKSVKRSTGRHISERGSADAAAALAASWEKESWEARYFRQTTKTTEITFDELMLAYYEAECIRKAKGGASDRSALKHLYRAFSGRAWTLIQRRDVVDYVRRRQASGAAASTINKEVALLSCAAKYGMDRLDLNLHNPAARCRLGEPEGRVRWITEDEARRLVNAARGIGQAPYLADLISVALHTGLRRKELLGLRIGDVHLDTDLIHVVGDVARQGRRRVTASTKTRRARHVPINEICRQAIFSRLRFRASHCPDTVYLFTTGAGRRILDVKRSFKHACRLAGIEDFSLHDCRHTFASWLVMRGTPLIKVRDLLGHSTIKLTEVYAHLAQADLQEAVQSLTSPRNVPAKTSEVLDFAVKR